MRDIVFMLFLGGALCLAFRYPFAMLLLWAWFTLASPHQATYYMFLQPLNVVIAIVTFASFAVHGEFNKMRFGPIPWLIVALGIWLTIAQQYSLMPEYSAPYYDRFVKVLVFTFLCATTITSRLRFHAMLWLLLLVIGFYGAKGAGSTIITAGQFVYFGPLDTILYDNNHLGIAMATCLPLFLYAIRQSEHRMVRTATWIVFALTIVAIIGTQSRGAFICLVIFGALMWFRSSNKMMSAVGIVAAAVMIVSFASQTWTDRISTIQDAENDASFQGRTEAWENNWLLAKLFVRSLRVILIRVSIQRSVPERSIRLRSSVKA